MWAAWRRVFPGQRLKIRNTLLLLLLASKKVKGKGTYLTSVAKQAKTAFLHGPTVWKSPIVGIEPATFRSESAALTTAPRDPTSTKFCDFEILSILRVLIFAISPNRANFILIPPYGGYRFLYSKLWSWTVSDARLFALKLCQMLEKICRDVPSSWCALPKESEKEAR